MSRLVLLLALLSFCYAPSFANAATIHVSVTAPDTVGKALAYELRERLASSNRHKLVIDEEEAIFKLKIVTMDNDDNGNRTVYSVVLVFRDYMKKNSLDFFLTSWVGVCGRQRTAACASQLASAVDAEVQPIIEEVLKELKRQEGAEGRSNREGRRS